jgi:GT2 family glycosyltransferase
VARGDGSLLLPVSAIIPTLDRPDFLRRSLDALAMQSAVPAEIIVIDASPNTASREVVAELERRLPRSRVRWVAAEVRGAAAQRNQGIRLASAAVIWFTEDDVFLQDDCLRRLWLGLQSDPRLGGVVGTIINQRYQTPGAVSRLMFALMNGKSEQSYAGRVLGPAVNLLPEDRDDLPEVVPVMWANTGCTMYRREALPDPPFDSVFTGYSMMEDLTLSLRVAEKWGLANVRTARVFHDSQPGPQKSNPRLRSCMELENRHYVMSRVLKRDRLRDYLKLLLWELFQVVNSGRVYGLRAPFWGFLAGRIDAVRRILAARRNCA